VQLGDRGVEVAARAGSGVLRAVASEDLGERVDRGRREQGLAADEAVRVAVVAGGEVEVVGGAAAGECDVQQLPGLLAGHDRVAGVGGLALGGVDGGGVPEVDVFADVLGGQNDGARELQVLDAEAAVGADGVDPPAVAVLDPVGAGEG